MEGRLKPTLLSLTLIAVGLAGVFLMSGFNERVRPAIPESYADEDLALSSERAKGFLLGTEGSVADWYWLQSLQYVGEKLINANEKGVEFSIENLKPLNPRLLYPQLDAATNLDPHFIAAYSYGAVVLPAIDPELAIKLTEKGIAANPGEWRLQQHLGYIYWRLGDFEKAAETYERGSLVPGAPEFFKMMVAQMKTQGGSRETARAMYRQMLDEAQDSQTKEVAQIKLKQIEWLYEEDAFKKALEDFKTKNNRCVNGWNELLPLLRNVKLPNNADFHLDSAGNFVDPTGVPYVLDKTACAVWIDPKKSKIPTQ